MAGDASFQSWLKNYLLNLNSEADADVLVSYIEGLLADEDEVEESLKEILCEIVDVRKLYHLFLILQYVRYFARLENQF